MTTTDSKQHPIMENCIYPTHTCFDDTLEVIAYQVKQDAKSISDLVLVHAICLLPDGEPYAHAWVEYLEEALFLGIIQGEKMLLVADKAEYRQGLRVQQETQYDFSQMLKNYALYDAAPWKPEYKALCKKEKKLIH